MAEDTFADTEHRMQGALDALNRDINTLRTGRATPALVERVTVEYYGATQPLQNLATIHAPDARTITIQPWDKKAVGDIEKAIQKSDLGLNPTNDGTVLRIVIPPLTEERRKDLVKVLHKKSDEAKVAVRNIRRDAQDHMRDQEKKKEISADDLKRDADRLQKMTDKYTVEVDRIAAAKEQEIMAV